MKPTSENRNEAVAAADRPAPDDPRVVQAVEDYLAALEAGQKPDRAVFLAAHAEVADVLADCLDGLELVYGTASGKEGPAGNPSPAAVAADLPLATPLGDFRLVRELGRGGMGLVYEAEQLSLGRRVALKVLPFAAALDPKQLRRFHTEAQAAAQLTHPHIVPVYAVGCERGVHYYAMQLIDGVSLAAMIRQLAGADAPPRPAGSAASLSQLPDGRGSEATAPVAALPTEAATRTPAFFRTAAQLGIQAAEALAYAHDQDVLHRDVKPANLLVDAKGHLWLSDFGLARLPNAPGLTLTGDVLGTLRYLSPEQALGQRERVDHRTDIYSLGVTLYELLTLRPAFPGSDRHALLRRVATEEPAPPRRLEPAIPADLETIVLKAMAKEPAERYATAQELADDLKRFLNDQPIQARRPTVWHKARKWARRRRGALTVALAMLGLGVVATLAVTLGLVRQAQQRAQMALAAEQQQRERAQAREKLALRAVHEMYTQVAEKWLASAPGMTDLQREFLEKALKIYQELAQENSRDEKVRHETAIAQFRMGNILGRLHRRGEAEAAHRAALAGFEELAAEFPGNRHYRYDVFYLYMILGDLVTDRMQEAEALHRKALALIERMAADSPDDPVYRDALAHQHGRVGAVLAANEKLEEAERVYRAGLEVVRQLIADYPDRLRYPCNLALNLQGLAGVRATTGRLAEAVEAAREALAVTRKYAADFSDELAYRHDLALKVYALADLLGRAGKFAESTQLLDEAEATLEKLTTDFPRVPGYRDVAVSIGSYRGYLHLAQGRPAEAEEAFTAFRTAQERRATEFPGEFVYRHNLADFFCNCPLERLRDPQQALAWAREGAALAPEHHPGWFLLGLALYRAGAGRDSLAALERSAELLGFPSPPVCFVQALAHSQLGDRERARGCYDEGVRRIARGGRNDEGTRQLRAEAEAVLGLAPPRQAGKNP
jgi:hypothetical protein